MTRALRLLLIDDEAADADLLLLEIRRGGYEPLAQRVHTRAALEAALDDPWDVILCGYRIPGLDALTALAIVREHDVATPCIIVSGAVDEEYAVQAVRNGAQDFISKDRLARLVPAIERELRDSAVRIKQARTEITLRATEASFRAAFELIPDGVLVHRDGVVLHANGAAAQLLGGSRERVAGLSVADLLGSDAPHVLGASSDALDPRTGRTPLVERTTIRLDGTSVDLEMSAMPVLFEGDEAVLTMIRDVSARRELFARTMHVDRMLAIGMLAAGVGHEINNPLAYIMANLGYAAEELARVEQALRTPTDDSASIQSSADAIAGVMAVLRDVDDGARRIRDIARDIKTYARGEDDETQPVDLREAADSAIRMAAPELRPRARVIRDYGEVPSIFASPSRVGQVLLNLIVNAAHAIGDGKPDVNEISVRIQADGPNVVVAIRDTGSGIAPEHVERLFTPFFTTKPVGKGTGLGLSISQGIVRSLGGDIHVDTELGRGTTMTVILPAARPPPPPEATARVAPSRRGRILFVDDERIVGTAVQRGLSREHEVVVGTAREALERLSRQEPFDAVFCDLDIPAMGAVDLFRAIARERPELARRIVVITGSDADPLSKAFVESQNLAVLEKPLDMHQVRAHLARVMAMPRG